MDIFNPPPRDKMETIVTSEIVPYSSMTGMRLRKAADPMVHGELLTKYSLKPMKALMSSGWYWRMNDPLLEIELEKRGLITQLEKDFLRAREQLLAGKSDTMPSWNIMDNHRQLFCERLAADDQSKWYSIKRRIHRAREASGSPEVASIETAKNEARFHRKINNFGLTGWSYTQETNLKTFPKFRRLPIEVRWMIWKYALPGPRLLVVRSTTNNWSSHRVCACGICVWFSGPYHTPNPALLFVNHESRVQALKKYRLIFGTTKVYADLAGGDILYFSHSGPDNILGYINHKSPAGCTNCRDLQEVRHILLSAEAMNDYLMNERLIARNNNQSPAAGVLNRAIALLPNLQKLWFVGNEIYPMLLHEAGALVAELKEPEPAYADYAQLNSARSKSLWTAYYPTPTAAAYLLGQMRKLSNEAEEVRKSGKIGGRAREIERKIEFGVADLYLLTRRSMRCDQEVRTGTSQQKREVYVGPGDYTMLFRNHFAPALNPSSNSVPGNTFM